MANDPKQAFKAAHFLERLTVLVGLTIGPDENNELSSHTCTST